MPVDHLWAEAPGHTGLPQHEAPASPAQASGHGPLPCGWLGRLCTGHTLSADVNVALWPYNRCAVVWRIMLQYDMRKNQLDKVVMVVQQCLTWHQCPKLYIQTQWLAFCDER